jgi:cobalt/nickel transport system permease protein
VHVPDGFIAPVVYLPLYGVAAGFWAYGARRVRASLDEDTLPYLAVLTGLAFVLSMVAIPLPGGTTVHAAGIGLLAVVFGVWTAFMAVSLVLVMQALLFGEGGVTSLPLNALAMGLVGAAAAWTAYRGLGRATRRGALFLAGLLSVVLPAALVALVLGLQPLVAHAEDGTPLFFPFGLSVTVPALLAPHLVIGLGEGVLTVLGHDLVQRLRGGHSP